MPASALQNAFAAARVKGTGQHHRDRIARVLALDDRAARVHVTHAVLGMECRVVREQVNARRPHRKRRSKFPQVSRHPSV